MTELRRVEPGLVPELSKALARAFERDPFYDWLIPKDALRARRFEWMFELLLNRYSLELSDTYATRGLEACAIWKPPGDYTLSFPEQLKAAPGFARVIGWRRLLRGLKLIEHMEGLHARLAPGPHVYLYVLGVDPAHQGRGLGGTLLRPRLERCDADGLDVYLETANADNVPFYERHGFVLRHMAEHPRFPTLWCMSRSPRIGKTG